MTRKQERKLRKRAHIHAAIATQDQWIVEAFGKRSESRQRRNALFAAARKIIEAKHAAS